MSVFRWPWTARLSMAVSLLLVATFALGGVHLARQAEEKAEGAVREARADDKRDDAERDRLLAGLRAANARLDALGAEPVEIPDVSAPDGGRVVYVPVPGPPGKDGAPGRDGVDGKDGRDGAVGPMGPAGPVGPRGEKGDKGDRGDTFTPPFVPSVASTTTSTVSTTSTTTTTVTGTTTTTI